MSLSEVTAATPKKKTSYQLTSDDIKVAWICQAEKRRFSGVSIHSHLTTKAVWKNTVQYRQPS